MTNTLKQIWVSPDNKIKKEIIEFGIFGYKPMDHSICTIHISDIKFKSSNMLSEYLTDYDRYPIEINIGESNTALDREIDKAIQMMHSNELSSVTIFFPDNEVNFVIKLCHFEFRGYIFDWNAKDKILMALKHKEKGVELFKENRYTDASHRFSRGMKLILSIPIPIDEIVEEIDGATIEEINKIKSNLNNNLASCYNKIKRYNTVIELCTNVLEFDEENQKALYKRGFAYAETRDFEKAHDDLTKLLSLNPENKAAEEKLQFVKLNISQQEANYNSMIKKMFRT